MDGDDLQLEEVKEKVELLLKMVSVLGSGSRRVACSAFSCSSFKSYAAESKFSRKFPKERLILL